MAKAGVTKFFKEVKQEGRKVTWPGRKEVMVTTVIVFIMVTIISMYLMFADWIIAAAISAILGV
jgi:preprotein translocase subunit SecE